MSNTTGKLWFNKDNETNGGNKNDDQGFNSFF